MWAKCYLLWQKLWYWIADCGLVWPYMALYGRIRPCIAVCGLVWPYVVFCGRVCAALSSCLTFSWSCMAFLWSFMAKYRFCWNCIVFSRGHRTKSIWSCFSFRTFFRQIIEGVGRTCRKLLLCKSLLFSLLRAKKQMFKPFVACCVVWIKPLIIWKKGLS